MFNHEIFYKPHDTSLLFLFQVSTVSKDSSMTGKVLQLYFISVDRFFYHP